MVLWAEDPMARFDASKYFQALEIHRVVCCKDQGNESP